MNNYYPFGLQHAGYNTAYVQEDYKYKFQGQERQDEFGLNRDSFKWRNYDYAIGRFFNIDPLSEKYSYQSHYNFSENRVVDGRELEGLEWVDTKGNLIYDPKLNKGQGGYTEFAINNEEKLGNALKESGTTGTQQFEKLVNADHPISLTIDFNKSPEENRYNIGNTKNEFREAVDITSGETISLTKTKSDITLHVNIADKLIEGIRSGNLDSKDKATDIIKNNKDLESYHLIISAFGHEIEHAVTNNSHLIEDTEKIPTEIGNAILMDIVESF
ncbi:MAG: hypothetical protein LBQ84_09095 [Flavobacteriaceae bacterium]|jgi:RHS repeat-associated protein|nr:hypothetical protein [Flavobacteriaceae bacterium]